MEKTNDSFQLKAADALNYGNFVETPVGAITFNMMTGDAPALAGRGCEVDIIESAISLTLGLIADAVEGGDRIDAVRAGQVADSLRLMASLTGFCVSSRNAIELAQEMARKNAGNNNKTR